MRPMRAALPHYMRPNHMEWSPPSCIFADTETTSSYNDDQEIMTLRLWCAQMVDRRVPKKRQRETMWDWGLVPEDMAIAFHKWCAARKTTWAYFHNLHFDLTVSRLVEEMEWLGWEVTDFSLANTAPFVRMRRKDSALTICDSFGWIPTKLADIGLAVGIEKPNLPQESDTSEEWLARCEADVRILSKAMLSIMAWWDKAKAGRWTITGAASGFNAMRHIPSDTQILIRPDLAEVEADRKAIYGGKRYVYQAGKLPYGRYSEIDIRKAYTVACRDCPLPTGRMERFDSLPNDHRWIDDLNRGIIAEVTLNTTEPLFPVKVDGTVWYPVGRFTTTLASPEIAYARELGCLESIGAGYGHTLGFALRPWATWLLDCLADTTGDVPEVVQMVMRNWGRTCTGKWNQHGYTRIKIGPAPTTGWGYEDAWNHNADAAASITDFAGIRWEITADGPSDNAYPAILAFIEANVRVALNKVIRAMGSKAPVCCDTDGLIARLHYTDGAWSDPALTYPFEVREKTTFNRVKVHGPQHLMLDERRRLAGVPGGAKDLPDGRMWARLWPKLIWQMANGRPGAYVRPIQHYRLATSYIPAWIATDGHVWPVEAQIDPDGCTRLLQWHEHAACASGVTLAPEQSKRVTRYLGA